jgi:hypothetical protein
VSPEDIARAARLWKEGMDTRAIAYVMQIKEHHVYNVLDRIKARARGSPWAGLNLDALGVGSVRRNGPEDA